MQKFQIWTNSLTGPTFRGEQVATNFTEACAIAFPHSFQYENGIVRIDGKDAYASESEAERAETLSQVAGAANGVPPPASDTGESTGNPDARDGFLDELLKKKEQEEDGQLKSSPAKETSGELKSKRVALWSQPSPEAYDSEKRTEGHRDEPPQIQEPVGDRPLYPDQEPGSDLLQGPGNLHEDHSPNSTI